jgi:hypothetical protein
MINLVRVLVLGLCVAGVLAACESGVDPAQRRPGNVGILAVPAGR